MKNRFIPFLLTVVGTLCFGGLFIVIFMNSTDVTCERQPNETYTCNMQTLFFGKIPTLHHTEENIVDIVIAQDSCTDGCGYRPEFIQQDGSQTPLTSVYTDRGPAGKPVSEIGAQMSRGAQTIDYRSDPPWWVLYLVVGLTVMSLFLSPLIFLRSKS